MVVREYLWLAAGLAALALLACRAGRIWMDAGRRGLDLAHRFGWALMGAVFPARYWWGARIGVLSAQERDVLLTHGTAVLGLSRADSLRCPLCGAEVPHAWTLNPDGHPTVAPGPIGCAACDFRLDACRHCVHFLPDEPGTGLEFGWGTSDVTFGRCGHYRASQSVEQACPPEVSRRLKAYGWECVRAPLSIVDSFVPPDFCTAFAPDRKRLRAGGIRWPDARHVALLRLLIQPAVPETGLPEELPSGDEQWLV